jgi:DNA-binding MarR family transcriptional regulator
VKKEDTIDYNIKISWHAIYRMYNQHAMKHDITTTIGFVLLNIDPKNGSPATKIAPMLGLESRSLTRILKSMEERELIFRKKDLEDGRSVRIHLTDEGFKKREVSRKTVLAFNEAVRARVAPKKLQTFIEVIENVNELIEENNLFESVK